MEDLFSDDLKIRLDTVDKRANLKHSRFNRDFFLKLALLTMKQRLKNRVVLRKGFSNFEIPKKENFNKNKTYVAFKTRKKKTKCSYIDVSS
jgi:hypothetical protein